MTPPQNGPELGRLREKFSAGRSPVASPKAAQGAQGAQGTFLGSSLPGSVSPVASGTASGPAPAAGAGSARPQEAGFNPSSPNSSRIDQDQQQRGATGGRGVSSAEAGASGLAGGVGGVGAASAAPAVAAAGEHQGASGSSSNTQGGSPGNILGYRGAGWLGGSTAENTGNPLMNPTIARLIRETAHTSSFRPLLAPSQPRSFNMPLAAPHQQRGQAAAAAVGGSTAAAAPAYTSAAAFTTPPQHLLSGAGAQTRNWEPQPGVPISSDSSSAVLWSNQLYGTSASAEGMSEGGLLSSSARGFARLNGGGGVSDLDSDEVALCLGYHSMLD